MDGRARISDLDLTLHHVAEDMSRSTPMAAVEALVFQVPPGGGHPQQPESRRQLAVVLDGTVTVAASGETRSCRPGDLLLVGDVTGSGHSSWTGDGATVLLIALPDGAAW